MNQHNDRALDNLFSLGAAWATYGLRTAQLAVQTSSHTLAAVSNILGELGDIVDAGTAREEAETAPPPFREVAVESE